MPLDIKTWSPIVMDGAGYVSMGVLATHRGLQLAEDIYRLVTEIPNKSAPYKIGNFSNKTTMALSVLSMPMVVSHAATAIEHIQSGQYTWDDIYALSGAIFLGVNLATTLFNPKSRLVAGVKLATFIGGVVIDVAGVVTAKNKKDFCTQLAMAVLFNSERGGPARALAKGAFDLVAGRSEVILPARPATTMTKLGASLLAGVLYAYSPSAHAATDPPANPTAPHGGGPSHPLPDGVPRDLVVVTRREREKRRCINNQLQNSLTFGADTDYEAIAKHFGFTPHQAHIFLRTFREFWLPHFNLKPVEPVDKLYELLSKLRDNDNHLSTLVPILGNTALNIITKPLGLDRSLEMAAAIARANQSWHLPNPEHARISNIPLARTRIGFSGYFVEVWPACEESLGGLDVFLKLENGTPLGYVSFLPGEREIYMITIQGTHEYSRRRNELCDLLGEDPFDWLVRGTSLWATSKGYEKLIGFSYRYNHWIDYHTKTSRFDAGDLNRYERLYNRRYERLGLKRSKKDNEIFERKSNSLESTPIIYAGFLRAMAILERQIPTEAPTGPHIHYQFWAPPEDNFPMD